MDRGTGGATYWPFHPFHRIVSSEGPVDEYRILGLEDWEKSDLTVIVSFIPLLGFGHCGARLREEMTEAAKRHALEHCGRNVDVRDGLLSSCGGLVDRNLWGMAGEDQVVWGGICGPVDLHVLRVR